VLYSLDLVTSAKLHPRTALILLTALNLLNYVDRSVLSRCNRWCRAKFRLSNTQVGYLTSAFLLFYMVAARSWGRWPTAIRGRESCWRRDLLERAHTTHRGHAHVYRVADSAHAGGDWRGNICDDIAPTFVADLFPEKKRGRILGIFYLAIPVGTAAGYLLGGNLSLTSGGDFLFTSRQFGISFGAGRCCFLQRLRRKFDREEELRRGTFGTEHEILQHFFGLRRWHGMMIFSALGGNTVGAFDVFSSRRAGLLAGVGEFPLRASSLWSGLDCGFTGRRLV